MQLRERRHAFGRRIDAIRRIEDAAGGLDQRIAEIAEQETALAMLQRDLDRLVRELQAASANAPAPVREREAVAA
jgi:uncharacterized coiled-coil protein SlyX